MSASVKKTSQSYRSLFNFNENGVCTNPEVLGGCYDTEHRFNSIEVAQAPNCKWCYGYQYNIDNGYSGGGCGCSLKFATYDTKRDAVNAAISKLKSIIDCHKNKKYSCDGSITFNFLRECIQNAFDEVNKLTMF